VETKQHQEQQAREQLIQVQAVAAVAELQYL
jgi:hypothetical protein